MYALVWLRDTGLDQSTCIVSLFGFVDDCEVTSASAAWNDEILVTI